MFHTVQVVVKADQERGGDLPDEHDTQGYLESQHLSHTLEL